MSLLKQNEDLSIPERPVPPSGIVNFFARLTLFFALAIILFSPLNNSIWKTMLLVQEAGYLPETFSHDPARSAFKLEDISNWQAFITSVTVETAAEKQTPGKRILNRLSPKVEISLSTVKPEDITDQIKRLIIQDLNALLANRDFYLKEAWKDVKKNQETKELLLPGMNTLKESEVVYLNRLLIEQAYPDSVVARPTNVLKSKLDKVSFAEIFLLGGFLSALLYIIFSRSWGLLRLFPLSLILFLIWMLISLSFHQGFFGQTSSSFLKASLKEIVQCSLYLIGGGLIFFTAMKRPRHRKLLLLVLALTVTVVAGLGWRQSYFMLWEGVAWGRLQLFENDISGTFFTWVPKKHVFAPNPGLYGMFFCLTLPILFGASLESKNRLAKIGISLLIIAVLGSMTSPGVLLALLAGLLFTAVLKKQWLAYGLLACILFSAFALVRYIPREHTGQNRLELLFSRLSPYESWDKIKQRGDTKQLGNTLKQQYNEWFAAGSLLLNREAGEEKGWRKNFWFGVGPGNYQKAINKGYLGYEDKNKVFLSIFKKAGISEHMPGTNSQWLILMVDLGIPGALLFLVFVFTLLSVSVQKAFHDISLFRRGILIGSAGAVLSLIIAGQFTELLVRGPGSYFALLIGLIMSSATRFFQPSILDVKIKTDKPQIAGLNRSHAETVILGDQTSSIEETKEEIKKPAAKPETQPEDVPENNVPKKEEQEKAPKQELPSQTDNAKLSLKERLARDLGQSVSNEPNETKED